MSSGTDQSCCVDVNCQCEAWLQRFCDYETVTHDYCGVTTVFQSSRSQPMPQRDVRPEVGIHQADRIWFVSRAEQDVESGVGAVLTDGDGTEWQVYQVQAVRSFCLWQLWCRNVSKCFALLDPVEIWEILPCESDCADGRQERLIARTRASILAAGGQARVRNDSDDMVVDYTARLEAWPKKAGPHPLANHQLRCRGQRYRVLSFEDSGAFVPFTMQLEMIQ